MPIRFRENYIGAWAYLIGVVLAVAVGVFAAQLGKGSVNEIVVAILAFLGLVLGFVVSEKDVQTFLIASVSVVLVSFAGIQGTFLSAAILGININALITNVLGALLFLFVPATIIVALKTVFAIASK